MYGINRTEVCRIHTWGRPGLNAVCEVWGGLEGTSAVRLQGSADCTGIEANGTALILINIRTNLKYIWAQVSYVLDTEDSFYRLKKRDAESRRSWQRRQARFSAWLQAHTAALAAAPVEAPTAPQPVAPVAVLG